MHSHFLFDSLLSTFGQQTRAVWSLNPSGGVLVFVHGFNGSAIRTWADFPVQVRRQAEFANWDAIFFGYDGVNTEAVFSATALRSLLDAMENPETFYESSDAAPHARRQHPKRYQRIVLVAHSLGAIVSRRAMLDGYTQPVPASWATAVELFNFAPAHRGAKLMSLMCDAFGPVGQLLAVLQLFNRMIVLRDLDEKGATVARLEAETVEAVGAGRGNLRAIDAVWAKNDPVVTNAAFAKDPAPYAPNFVEGRTHSSVCKPDDRYSVPVAALKRYLS